MAKPWRRFELYGWRYMRLNHACQLLAAATGAAFERHASDSASGGEYYLGEGREGQEITVQENAFDEDGYPFEPDFPEHHTLVYVNRAGEAPGSPLVIEGIELLRSEVV